MTTMTMATREVARERQLDWLLDEALGTGERRHVHSQRGVSWLAAAMVVLAVGVAFGVAMLRGDDAARMAQEPVGEPAFHECHGPAELDKVPADVTALRCFDFDDAACARLAKFTKLERLDLSGMDVNDKGYSVSLPITDTGVRELGKITGLRWLCLARCHAMKGEGLQALEALPRLEHLDVTYSGILSPAVERLSRLPSLRTLVLSHCMNFHGDSLRAVAKIPGLRRLELRACTTIAAKDALHLVQLKELRHLDLRDCQGHFRGQRMDFGFGLFKDTDGDGLPDTSPQQPLEDGNGITDEVIAALSTRPLHTLLLGGCESLTDAIGDSLAKMTALRVLDVSNLPKTDGSLLAKLSNELESLELSDNGQYAAAELARMPALPRLRSLGLSGLKLDAPTLERVLASKPLRTLALGGRPSRGKGDRATQPTLDTAAAMKQIATLADLESLDLRDATFVDRRLLEAVARLPKLRSLDLTAPLTNPLIDRNDAVAGLAANTSLHSLRLVWNRLTPETLQGLRNLPLKELDLRGTTLTDKNVREIAATWPGCRITLQNGQILQAR